MIEILCHDGAAEVLCPPEQAGGFEQAAKQSSKTKTE